jgi:predicted dehydrogenase
MKFRGAILGCGQVTRHHLRAWSQIDDVEIIALYNRTLSKAMERASEFNIPLDHVYGDYHELLDKEDVDFIDIATTPQIHREQVEAVAAHGKHILCQKPLAPTIEDAIAMISICDKANILLSVNENWRWRSWYRNLKKILDEGIIGRPRYVSITKHRSAALPGINGSPPPLTAEPSLLEFERLIVYDWGIHLIDLLRFLFGEITNLHARMGKGSPYFKGEDRAVLSLDISGIMGVIDISWSSIIPQPDTINMDIQPENITIEGDNGTLELREYENVIRIITKGKISDRIAYEGSPLDVYQGSYTAAQKHFIECIKSGQLPETEAKDNIKTLMVTLAAYESAAQNNIIILDYDDVSFWK